MKKLLMFSLAIGLVVILAGIFVMQSFTNGRPSDSSEEVIYEITQGKTFHTITHELEERGVIRNATLFFWYARLKGLASKTKIGEYGLAKNLTPSEVLAVLISGKSIGHPFTVTEGLNIFEIADLYQEAGFGTKEAFIKLCLDKNFIKQQLGEEHQSLEGYLFPETYQITKFTTTKELLQSMVHRFQEVYAQVIPESELKGWTKHQIVTLASIVEKETGAPEERPLISSIFHNRLQKGMMLQTDPTILYGMAELSGKMVLKISKADILRPTKYNTYVIKGLPPGPIANPGREALLAAMKPAHSNYFYFVSKNDGTSIFSETYESHAKAVKKFQLDPHAREGKSWRDLKNRKVPPAAVNPGA